MFSMCVCANVHNGADWMGSSCCCVVVVIAIGGGRRSAAVAVGYHVAAHVRARARTCRLLSLDRPLVRLVVGRSAGRPVGRWSVVALSSVGLWLPTQQESDHGGAGAGGDAGDLARLWPRRRPRRRAAAAVKGAAAAYQRAAVQRNARLRKRAAAPLGHGYGRGGAAPCRSSRRTTGPTASRAPPMRPRPRARAPTARRTATGRIFCGSSLCSWTPDSPTE